MYLGNVIKEIDKKYRKVFFSGLAFNSSKVKKGDIFFAIKGNKYDGNKYVHQAIKKGASVIISEEKFKSFNKNVTYLNNKNPRKLLSQISSKLLKRYPKRITAVTGTNGKSSVADFYYQILSLNKKKAGSIGTVGIQFKGKKKMVQNTTLDPLKLRKTIEELNFNKVENIILEASSHGLKQNRLDGLLFDIGIFTNLSHDHLDYHKNLKDYLNSKLYLFQNLIKKKGSIIVDPSISQFHKFKSIAKKKNLKLFTVYEKKSNLELISHKYENDKQVLKIKYKSKIFKVELNLIGKIQIKNVLMAVLAALKSGTSTLGVINKINRLKPVEGRLEKIGNLRNGAKILLDYAHTPDALETVLSNVKDQFPKSKISLVFGCGGDRDKEKRFKMGKISSIYADKIYLTDDNPRSENPQKIRNEIKKGIKNKDLQEISSRKKAIYKCIKDLQSGDIAIIAGKGHEKTQEYKGKKKFFSDRKEILESILLINKFLFKDKRLNILQEKTKILLKKGIKFNKACINSKEIKINDIFFAIKGKKVDANNFLNEAFKNGSTLSIVNRINRKFPLTKQIKVENTLNFMTECASSYRNNVSTKIISITGSCGKTTLKEMISSVMKKISKISYSPKSYNNKYGVPLSLLNLKQDNKFGIFEAGMDKKGEIDYLTKILNPDLGIITNISYAHSKNFKNIKGIANAKGEMINNIKSNGSIILNADDHFFDFHRKKALKKKLKVFSFSMDNKKSNIKFSKITKINKIFKIFFKINSKVDFFYSQNISKSYIQNFLATIATLNSFFDLDKLSKKIFLDFKLPEGRGDISKLRLGKKLINFIDESYNSNPLSLKTALKNFGNLRLSKVKKHILLGDMLELGHHSVSQHYKFGKIINKLDIDKVHIIGRDIKKTYRQLKNNKKGLVLNKTLEINNLINKELSNNDYLMIKGSNSTGLYKASQILKKSRLNAL